MGILTLNQTIEQGSSPSELRAIANSLERIARQGYFAIVQDGDREFTVHEPAYDFRECRSNARALRVLVRQLSETQSRGAVVLSLEPA